LVPFIPDDIQHKLFTLPVEDPNQSSASSSHGRSSSNLENMSSKTGTGTREVRSNSSHQYPRRGSGYYTPGGFYFSKKKFGLILCVFYVLFL